MRNIKYFLEGKLDYKIYHKSFTDALDEVLAFVKKNGYEVKDDDIFNEVSTKYPRARPSEGKTNSFKLQLYKDDKPSRRYVNFQVYGLSTQYELNIYIS